MAQQQKGGGVVDNVRGALSKNPATERLFGELETFVRDRAADFVDSLGDRISDTTDRLEEFAANGGMVKRAAKATSDGDGPMKAGLKAVGGGLKDKLGELVGGGDGGAKATVIGESIEVGVPVSVAYNQWTQFQEFGRFTKGVQGVEQEDDVKTNWKVKVFWSTRSWDATITEQIPDERIAWTSDGEKGSVNGAVTFHELAPNLTKVLLELEYHPKGLFEKTGNLWRAQGRRARLDLKQFRRFVMLRGEETGAWRGEIHDSEVTKSPGQNGSSSRRRSGDSKSTSRGRGDDRASSSGQGDERRDRADERRRSRDARRKERRQARSSSRRERDEPSSSEDKPSAPSTQRKSASRAKRSTSTSPRKSTSRAKKASAPAKKTTRQRTQAPAKKTTTRKTTTGRKTAGGRKSASGRQSTSGRKSTTARKR